MSDRIRGVLAPVVTPFDGNLAPSIPRLVAHCEWLLSRDCGLAVFGTNSEGNSLTLGEKSELLTALVDAGLNTQRMMPGTGSCSIGDTVTLSAQAARLGCAGVLMLPPFYYKGVTEDGLFRYFSEVIQRVGDNNLRVYLYHIPPVAVVGITPALVERLLKAYPDTIAGMKDSSGDMANTNTFLDAFAAGGFDVFVGSETFLLKGMLRGGAGCISATANVNPGAIHQLFLTAHDDSAPAQQERLDTVRSAIGKNRLMIAALKGTVAHFTRDLEWTTVRPPLVSLSNGELKDLKVDLDRVGFTMDGVGG